MDHIIVHCTVINVWNKAYSIQFNSIKKKTKVAESLMQDNLKK